LIFCAIVDIITDSTSITLVAKVRWERRRGLLLHTATGVKVYVQEEMSIGALFERSEIQRLSALLAVVALSDVAVQHELDQLLQSLLLDQLSLDQAQGSVRHWLDQVRAINPDLVCVPQDVAWLAHLVDEEVSGRISMIVLLVSALQLISACQQSREGKPPFLLISDLARQTHRSDEQWRAVIARAPERYAAFQIRGISSPPRLWVFPKGIASSLRLLFPQRGRSATRSSQTGDADQKKRTVL
jgi:hypothetical protein